MYTAFFHLLARINSGLHFSLILAGIVFVHVAAYLLYAAIAPIVGCILAFFGFACYAIGNSRPLLKPVNARQSSALF